MATSTNVKKMQAADPGVGFEMDFQGLDNNIKGLLIHNALIVTLSITDHVANHTHITELTISPPITDPQISFLMPFGCDLYQPGDNLTVSIEAKIASHPSPTIIYNNSNNNNQPHAIFAQGGVFDFGVQRTFLPSQVTLAPTEDQIVPSILRAGESIWSDNKRYFCRMDFDGKLAIYDVENNPSIPTRYSPPCPENASKGKYYLSLNEDGNLCFYPGEGQSFQNSYWSTAGAGGLVYPVSEAPFHIRLTDEGKLFLYKGKTPLDNPEFKFDITSLLIPNF